jgi:cation:H+ antiporter
MMPIIALLAGLVILFLGGELFVRSASRLATIAGIPPMIIGLTVVSYGTSAPEAAVTVQAVMSGQTGLALGNIVGSNISNILLILGITALVAPLVVTQRLIRLDMPILIGVSLVILLWSTDLQISRIEGLFLLLGAVVYTLFAILESRTEPSSVKEEYTQEFGRRPGDKPGKFQILKYILFLSLGLAGLVSGANIIVNASTGLARIYGLSELIIGLTIVAIGTSLPELATSVVASIRGEKDIAIGNIIGSCLFNLLFVLGLSASVTPQGLPVPPAILYFDLPVMIAVFVACLPLFFNGFIIMRWEGALLVSFYCAYLLYLVLTATQHELLPAFSSVMIQVVFPISIFLFIILLIQSYRTTRKPAK